MKNKFSAKRCTVDELLLHLPLINELAGQRELPGLNFAVQQYRALESRSDSMCALLMDGAEAVGFLITRRQEQGNTAVLDVALARPELREEWGKELGELAFTESKSMAQDMDADGIRIPHLESGPASGVLTGQVSQGAGTQFFEVI